MRSSSHGLRVINHMSKPFDISFVANSAFARLSTALCPAHLSRTCHCEAAFSSAASNLSANRSGVASSHMRHRVSVRSAPRTSSTKKLVIAKRRSLPLNLSTCLAIVLSRTYSAVLDLSTFSVEQSQPKPDRVCFVFGALCINRPDV